MKKLILAASFSSFTALAHVIPAPVTHLFVPSGFDNNDNVELVVKGKFPNPCYTRNKVEVQVKEDKILVNVTATKNEKQNNFCEPLAVPFTEVITIGSLQGGDYEIIINEKLKQKMTINVASSNSVDENLYASVDYVDLGFTGGASGEAIIVGKSLSDCLILDRVEYLSNEKDTYSILPIMRRISQDCAENSKRIDIPVKVNLNKFASKEVLLFVRSVDGKSVHSIIEK